MRRYALPVLAILAMAGVQLLPSPTAAQSSFVEVTFRCPFATGILTFDWRDPLGGEYTEGGKRHDLKFRITGMSMAPNLSAVSGPQRSGGGIKCDYRSSTGSLNATYVYDVHREIISCSSSGGALMCKLKP